VYFPYLSKEWKKNCEKERLLGVSITGQWDSEVVRDPKVLEKMKQVAIETNKKYAKRFAVSQSTCITCVKPSGTVSQTVDCASGYCLFQAACSASGLADKHGNAPDEQQVKHHRGIPTYIVAQQVSHVAQVQRPGDNAQPEQVQRHEYRQAREKQAEMLHVLRLR
jgi:hypothetical protein